MKQDPGSNLLKHGPFFFWTSLTNSKVEELRLVS